MPGNIRLLLVAVMVLLSAARAQQMVDYGLEEILAFAAGGSAELRIARLEYLAGRQEIWVFRAEALPGIDFSVQSTYISQSTESQITTGNVFTAIVNRVEGIDLGWSIGLRQPVITFGRTGSALALADQQQHVLSEQLALDRDRYYLAVIRGFGVLVLAQADLRIAESAAARAGQLLKQVRVEVAAGLAARSDSLRILGLRKNEEADLVLAGQEVSAGRRLLARLVGLPPDLPFRVHLSADRYGGLSVATHVADSTSREIKLKEYEVEMLRERARLERAALFPTISVVGGVSSRFLVLDTLGYGERFGGLSTDTLESTFLTQVTIPEAVDLFDPAFFSYAIGAELSWPLFNGGRRLAQYRRTKYQAERAEEELVRLRLETRIAIERAIGLVGALEESTEAFTLQRRAVRTAYDRVKEDYLMNLTDITELLAVEREMQEAERAVVNARVRRLEALAQLRLLLGLSVYEERQ